VLRRVSPRLGLAPPARPQLLGRRSGVDLRCAGPVGGDLEAPGALVRRERPSEVRGAIRDQLVAERLQFVPSRRPLLEERVGHTDDLRGAVVIDAGPLDSEPLGQLRPQRRLVEHPGRLLRREELPPIESEPGAVVGSDLVRYEDVSVELRVRRARGPVDESGCDEPLGVHLEDAVVAAAGEGRVVLQERQRRSDGRVVRRKDLVGDRLVADRPQRRDALRWREREREAGDGALVVGIEAAPEWGTRARVCSVAEEPLELAHGCLVVGDPEGRGAAAEEAAGTLRALREVILAAPHDLLGVVAPGRGRHRREAHHRRGAPATPSIGDAAVSSLAPKRPSEREGGIGGGP